MVRRMGTTRAGPAMTETRRLTVLLPLPQIDALRQQLRPGEGMNELLKRLIDQATTVSTPTP